MADVALKDRIVAMMREHVGEELCDHDIADWLGVSWMDAYFALGSLEFDRLVTPATREYPTTARPFRSQKQGACGD